MHGVFLLFQYPFFVILAITVAVARQTVTCLSCGTSFFALKLSIDNKDFLKILILSSQMIDL